VIDLKNTIKEKLIRPKNSIAKINTIIAHPRLVLISSVSVFFLSKIAFIKTHTYTMKSNKLLMK